MIDRSNETLTRVEIAQVFLNNVVEQSFPYMFIRYTASSFMMNVDCIDYWAPLYVCSIASF